MKRCHTLSGKLVALFVIIALLFVVMVGGTISHAFRSHFQTEIRPHLVHYMEYIQRDIGIPPDRQKAEALARKLDIEIMLIDEAGSWSSHQQQIELEDIDIHHSFSENGVQYRYGEADDRYLLICEVEHNTLIFTLPRIERNTTDRLLPLAVMLTILLLLYGGTHRLFRPIETIRNGVQRFGSGELDLRINLQRRDELGELADSFNTMANDIQQMLEAKRQLLLAISHELRSPMTRAKVSLEFIENETQREELNRDLNEMERLIEELLETERLSTSHRVLNRASCDINRVVTELVEERFTGEAVTLQLPPRAIHLSLDATRIRLVLKNLLENALRYSPEDTRPPQLTVKAIGADVSVEVRDFGEGIEEQHIAHLTEPFYRADTARQRQTGGYGLGLYLCRVIAEAHGGELFIESEKGEGTTITLTLPNTDDSER